MHSRRFFLLSGLVSSGFLGTILSRKADASIGAVACAEETFSGTEYVICRVSVADVQLRVAHADASGTPYGRLQSFVRAMEANGRTVPFAMNGGMYHRDFSPVGYLVEDSDRLKKANTRPGPGNFHMLPNGIFWADGGRAGVSETNAFLKVNRRPAYATQSGPLLLERNKVHPRFKRDSTSRKIRNGVGVKDGGRTALFALSKQPVTFWEFATLFRDHLGTPDALYLDGTISSVHAPSIGRSDRLFPVGPIIAVVE